MLQELAAMQEKHLIAERRLSRMGGHDDLGTAFGDLFKQRFDRLGAAGSRLAVGSSSSKTWA